MSGTRGEPGLTNDVSDDPEHSTGPAHPSPVTPGRGEEGRAHVRGSVLLVVGRVLALFIGMATTVILVRALTKAEYGAFEYALTLAGAGRILLSLGQGRLLSRFMAGYEESGDYPRMFGAMFLAVGTICVTSIPLIAAFFVWSEELLGSAVDSDAAVRLVLVLLFVAPMEALDQVFVSLFAVFSKPRAIFFRKHLLAPGLRLGVVLVLWLTGQDVMFLAVGYLIASAAGLLLYVGLLVAVLHERGLWRHFDPRKVILPYRAVFEFSFPLITGELALLSMKVGGVMVLARYHPITEIASYRAVFGVARLNTAVTTSFATLFLPVIARLHARDNIAELRESYWHTATFVAVTTFPIFALTGPLAPATTLALLGQRYADSALVLSILAVGYYLNVMFGFNVYALQVCGRIRLLVGVNLFMSALNIGLCFALADELGAVGIAIANCAALTAQNLINQWGLRRSISTAFIPREAWSSYLQIVAGALLLWLFALLASPGIVLSVLAAILVSAVIFFGSQRSLQLAQTFPELRRLPLIGRVVR
jgi:O-antigen/teichoic acid export membrane protein